MRELPVKNEHPVLYAAAAVGVVLVVFVITGFVRGTDPAVIGRLSGSLIMAGAMLAGWGSVANGRWSRLGLLGRLALCWFVLTAAGLVCGVPMKSAAHMISNAASPLRNGNRRQRYEYGEGNALS